MCTSAQTAKTTTQISPANSAIRVLAHLGQSTKVNSILHFQRLLWIAALMLLGSCAHVTTPISGVFEARVNTNVAPGQTTILAQGHPQPVAASRDDKGVQSDFLEGVILLKPKSAADLQSFLDRYDGTIVADDTIPEPSPDLDITLTAEQRKPIQFKVRINLARVNVAGIPANGAAAGLTGTLEFSSEAGRQTFAGILDAKAAGFRASGDYIYYGNQVFPHALFKTEERQISAGPPATFNDPFTNPAYADFGTTGNQSNVFLAWQFIAAHGIQRRTRVAIIDGGFYLDAAGRARGTDSDFPSPLADHFNMTLISGIHSRATPARSVAARGTRVGGTEPDLQAWRRASPTMASAIWARADRSLTPSCFGSTERKISETWRFAPPWPGARTLCQ